MHYTGIEPDKSEAAKAQRILKYPNTTIHNSFAYKGFEKDKASYDIVLSLSVLEHVKDLEAFLSFSLQQAKKGATIIHLYDLGHALHSSSISERIQVAACNGPLRFLMPESRIACYVDLAEVQTKMKRAGAKINKVTRHNSTGAVEKVKHLPDTAQGRKLALQAEHLEMDAAQHTKNLSTIELEKLYPSICVWATKR